MVEVDPDKLVMMVIGLIVSIIAYFIKKESNKLSRLGEDVRELQNGLTKNECKDSERWYWINKNMEDRRNDCIKLYDMVSKIKEKRDD
jgi:predicted Holliday junction resolvase-like endonuclease